jgi:hypothetical protein
MSDRLTAMRAPLGQKEPGFEGGGAVGASAGSVPINSEVKAVAAAVMPVTRKVRRSIPCHHLSARFPDPKNTKILGSL